MSGRQSHQPERSTQHVGRGAHRARDEAIGEAFAHASRFVRPGAQRIASTSGGEGIESVAFQNADDGSIALIVVNTHAQEKNLAVRIGGRMFDYTLPAGAVATFRWS